MHKAIERWGLGQVHQPRDQLEAHELAHPFPIGDRDTEPTAFRATELDDDHGSPLVNVYLMLLKDERCWRLGNLSWEA
jgi:hypothetical protein